MDEQQQRIEGKLAFLSQKVDESVKETASLKQSVDELDLKIKHMRETGEKSLKTLQKQVKDLAKRWEDLDLCSEWKRVEGLGSQEIRKV